MQSCRSVMNINSLQVSSSSFAAAAGNPCCINNPSKSSNGNVFSKLSFGRWRGSFIMTTLACARPDSSRARTNVEAVSSSELTDGKRTTLRELAEELRKGGGDEILRSYEVCERERPKVRHNEFADLPIIDLALIDRDRRELSNQLGKAAREWGFFQIINHGLSVDDLKEIETQGYKFFQLPAEIKLKLDKQGYFSNNTEVKQSSLHWAESWMLNFGPRRSIDEKINIIFPNGNAELRNAIDKFCRASETVNKLILELLAEHLGLETDFFSQHLNSRRSLGLRLNYYPACPQPSHVLGANVHTDGSSLTILQQDKVGGLQIQRDGQWFGVKPIEDALVVNVGDALHAWTNGHFKSVLHRVVLNKEVDRLSFAAFLNVDNSLLLSAPDQLVDENHPRLYKPFTFGDYIQQVLKARSEDKDESKTMMDGNCVLAGLRYDSQTESDK